MLQGNIAFSSYQMIIGKMKCLPCLRTDPFHQYPVIIWMDSSSPTVQCISHVEMEDGISPDAFSAYDIIWCGIAMYCIHPKIHCFILLDHG